MLSLTGSMAALAAGRNKREYPAARFTGQQPVIAQKTAHQGDSVHFSGSFLSRLCSDDNSVKINASDPNGTFSTYKLRPIVIDNQTWKSVEHYFQARKFMRNQNDVWDSETLQKIKMASRAKKAAAIAAEHNANIDRAWDNENRTGADVRTETGETETLKGKKFQVMYIGLKAMFDQYPAASQELLATGNKKLVASRNNSNTWGGELNAYGKMLMRIRHELAQSQQVIPQPILPQHPVIQNINHLTTYAETQRFWRHIQAQLERHPHSKVLVGIDGEIRVQQQTNGINFNIPGMNPDDQGNPLRRAASNPRRYHRANSHFVVVQDLKWEVDKPHFLILPRPKAANNYRDMLDFLHRGTPDEKISLMNMMQELMTTNPTPEPVTSQLFRANNGRCHDIPYLHVHYKPYTE